MRLTPAFSGYLDALRFGAALAVLLGHMMQNGYDLAWLPLAHLSHEAVIVFFVMSGLIIASVTMDRKQGWRTYAASRMARIYSVALPAVIFSMAFTWAVTQSAPSTAAGLTFIRPPAALDAVSSLLFLNESWSSSLGTDLKLSMNGPYWSLCYEVWYYVIFGAFFFAKGSLRWWLACALALAAGPAVMVMFPIWCAGAWLAFNRKVPSSAQGHWLWGFMAAPLVMLLIDTWALDLALRDWIKAHFSAWWHLGSSQRFLTDIVMGLFLAWHLNTFERTPPKFRLVFERHAQTLAKWAGFSFTLYLFHMPLVTVAGAFTPAHLKGPVASVAWAGLFVGVCWLISHATEQQLPRWRSAMTRLLSPR